jgi:hypothetical protein
MSVLVRNNVHTVGTGPTAMLFAHGFGCDQNTCGGTFRQRSRTGFVWSFLIIWVPAVPT